MSKAPITVKPKLNPLDIYCKGNPLVRAYFPQGKYTREQIQEYANKLSNDAKSRKLLW